jgi:hypothetical protein
MRALKDSFPLNPSSMICSMDSAALEWEVEVQPDTAAISAAASATWEEVRRFTGISKVPNT